MPAYFLHLLYAHVLWAGSSDIGIGCYGRHDLHPKIENLTLTQPLVLTLILNQPSLLVFFQIVKKKKKRHSILLKDARRLGQPTFKTGNICQKIIDFNEKILKKKHLVITYLNVYILTASPSPSSCAPFTRKWFQLKFKSSKTPFSAAKYSFSDNAFINYKVQS